MITTVSRATKISMTKSNPWSFEDSELEKQYHVHFAATLLDRSKTLLKWNLVGVWVMNATVSICGLMFGDTDSGLYLGIAIRMFASVTGTILFLIKWSEEYKPKIAHLYLWMTRAAFAFAAAIQAGMKQPDSKLKMMLLWSMYVGGVFFPTFTEYLLISVAVAYLELVVLILLNGSCPVDSSRPCTNYELWEQFGHHTLYICIAAWIHHHIHSDRRKEFYKLVRGRRALRAARSSGAIEAEIDPCSDSETSTAALRRRRRPDAPYAASARDLARPASPSAARPFDRSTPGPPWWRPQLVDADALRDPAAETVARSMWAAASLPREEAGAGAALRLLVRPLRLRGESGREGGREREGGGRREGWGRREEERDCRSRCRNCQEGKGEGEMSEGVDGFGPLGFGGGGLTWSPPSRADFFPAE